MAASLPGVIPVPFILLIVVVIVIVISIGINFLFGVFAMQIPNVMHQITSQMKRKPGILVHYVNRRVQFFSPNRKGDKKHKNTLTLPEALGAKFDASNKGLEELWGKSVLYHYYSKASYPILPTHVKAVHDFYDEVNKKGIAVNEELIDVLFIRDCDITDVYTKPLEDAVIRKLPVPIQTDKEWLLNEDRVKQEKAFITGKIESLEYKKETEKQLTRDEFDELQNLYGMLNAVMEREKEINTLHNNRDKVIDIDNNINKLKEEKEKTMELIDLQLGYLDPDTKEQIYSLKRLKKELQETIIKDGLFIFPLVENLIFASSSLNSAGMNEAVNIANADAFAQMAHDPGDWTLPKVAMVVVILVVLFAGIGLGIKLAFG